MAEALAPIRFAVLGPVRGWRAGVEVDLGPPQQKAVLAVLLVRAGQPVGLSEIVDVLWGDDPPDSAVNVVHRYVGKLRRLIEPDLPVRAAGRLLVRGAGGYRLELSGGAHAGPDADVVDLLRFRRLRDQAREASRDGCPDAAVTLLLAALGLWHGPCAAGTEAQVRAHPMFTAVDHEQLAAVQELADAALGSGGCGVAERVLPVVRQAAAGNGWDEPLQARLVLVLAATGRQAEALAVYEQVRSRLAEELGIDPGSELRAAHEQVLRQQPAQAAADGHGAGTPRSPAPASPVVRPAQLPADVPTFTGRDAELARVNALLAGGARAGHTVVISAIAGMVGVGKPKSGL
jgi:DNA-binding SARP family transcriptional activator